MGGNVVRAGIDFNVDDLMAELFMEYGDGGVHFFDEIHLSNATTYELADKLHERYPGITVFPDPAGRDRRTSALATDFTILRDKGFTVEARAAQSERWSPCLARTRSRAPCRRRGAARSRTWVPAARTRRRSRPRR